jgi:hypothetical protein
MTDNRVVKIARNKSPNGKRPRKRWCDLPSKKKKKKKKKKRGRRRR